MSASHPPPAHPDTVSVLPDPRLDEIRRRLDDLLTRSFYSGAGYVFESDPYVVPEDAEVLEKLTVIREQDRRHAHVLGTLIAARGGVPGPGVFPFWNLDLNFLTVPTVSQFVVDALHEEIGLYDLLIARWPAADDDGRAALRVIRDEKARQVADLAPAVAAAKVREAEAHVAKAAAVKKTRDARIAKQKAAAEAAKKAKAAAGKPGAVPAAAAAAAPVAAAASAEIGDPLEPGISKKEKGRRALLRIRKKLGLPMSLLAGKAAPAATPAAAPVAAPAAAAPAGAVLDPDEPGISPKEKAKRQMLKMRAAAGGAAPAAATAPAAAPVATPPPAAAPAAELLDPNEPGISPKEKAKRQMLKLRAASGAPAAAPAAAAPAAPAPVASVPAAPAVEALPADLGDPNEPGISPKEKARRQMARLRAQRG